FSPILNREQPEINTPKLKIKYRIMPLNITPQYGAHKSLAKIRNEVTQAKLFASHSLLLCYKSYTLTISTLYIATNIQPKPT
ncbi:hypothetical protein, partial [Pseudoalteromonas sp. T1lg76]|uniref:hypothetical protein n=1 Tax=Pseudoalteromonas sp. T1lg76 TaxID=2077103 RepID=UPI001F2EE4B7